MEKTKLTEIEISRAMIRNSIYRKQVQINSLEQVLLFDDDDLLKWMNDQIKDSKKIE